jgi:isocitrate dehydrogenase kinase/phosphatase
VKLPAGITVEALANVPEVHEAVVARLLTTTSWFPAALPEAADAETMLEFDDVTVLADKGPTILFKFCMSLSRFVASVCSEVNAVVWLWRVAS